MSLNVNPGRQDITFNNSTFAVNLVPVIKNLNIKKNNYPNYHKNNH